MSLFSVSLSDAHTHTHAGKQTHPESSETSVLVFHSALPPSGPLRKTIEYTQTRGEAGEKVAYAAFTTFCFNNNYSRLLVEAAIV